MRFVYLNVFGFRNLVDSEIDVDSRDVFLVGENGQGKSNFLEAVYFCSYASSFRSAVEKDLICSGKNECSVIACAKDFLEDKIRINIGSEKKSIMVNDKSVKDRKVLLSIAPSVVFCHEDMRFINGTPEQRRWFFDQNLCLYDYLYIDDLRKYKKLLKSRNTVLKEIKDRIHSNYELLETIDLQFVICGLELTKRRSEETKLFSKILNPLFQMVSNIDNVNVEYRSSWKFENEDEILNMLKSKRKHEINFGLTLSGPHRDNYFFTRNNDDFSKKASTGQRRLLSLIIRVAQAQRYFDMRKSKPVLLLDDVLLELDREKKIRFLSLLPDYDQAFYTFLPEEPYDKYKKDDTLVYKIKNGNFNNEKN